MKQKGLLIGGTHSGCGKTTVTMGLIRAFKNRGFDIQPWKAGPDYIDPGFHSAAAERKCRNLDTMILEDKAVREIYDRQKCQINIIEGVMGLFDGAGGLDERGSAAHLAKDLHLPVILVIDAKAMARSAGAIALGFATFDKDLHVAGFIMNRVGSKKHYKMLKEAVEEKTGLPVLGYLERNTEFSLPERHLGLIPSWEKENLNHKLERLASAVEETFDMDRIISISDDAGERKEESRSVFIESIEKKQEVKIAVAMDEAFHFYYEENLDLLKHCGAELHYFSPINDASLPDDIDGVYLGGGYPELHGAKLSANESMKEKLRALCSGGMPLFAECGGFMYLTEGIVNKEGDYFSMLGLFPGKAVMGKKLRSLGYCEATLKNDTVIGSKGTSAKGHVFHWTGLEEVPSDLSNAMSVVKGDENLEEGFTYKNVLGSWVHLHFASNPQIAATFVAKAAKYRSQRH